MKVVCFLGIVLLPVAVGRAEPPLPTTEGTTWHYEAFEEVGGPTAAPPTTTAITVRLSSQTYQGRPFTKLETMNEDTVTRTELVTLDNGWVCHFRAGKDGRMARLDPPETIVPASLKAGDTWESDGEVAGMAIHERFQVVGEEMTRVPAGNFRAFHIHCEDASVMSVVLDRWFVSGIGFVKEVTVVRGPTGGLLQRVTLELQQRPEVIAKPKPTPTPPSVAQPPPQPTPTATPQIKGPAIETDPSKEGKRLTVEVSTDPSGGSKSEFKSDAENIYVRWHGHGLPKDARIRVAWIAEDVGDLVEPNFTIDETESVAPAPDASARFTLGRPPDGWAEGKYRVEFYVNDELEETVRVTIAK